MKNKAYKDGSAPLLRIPKFSFRKGWQQDHSQLPKITVLLFLDTKKKGNL